MKDYRKNDDLSYNTYEKEIAFEPHYNNALQRISVKIKYEDNIRLQGYFMEDDGFRRDFDFVFVDSKISPANKYCRVFQDTDLYECAWCNDSDLIIQTTDESKKFNTYLKSATIDTQNNLILTSDLDNYISSKDLIREVKGEFNSTYFNEYNEVLCTSTSNLRKGLLSMIINYNNYSNEINNYRKANSNIFVSKFDGSIFDVPQLIYDKNTQILDPYDDSYKTFDPYDDNEDFRRNHLNIVLNDKTITITLINSSSIINNFALEYNEFIHRQVNDGTVITLTSNSTIENGIIIFRFALNNSSIKRFYIKITNKVLECKGISNDDSSEISPLYNESVFICGNNNESELERLYHLRDIRLSNYAFNILYENTDFINEIDIEYNSLKLKAKVGTVNRNQVISFWTNKNGPITGLIVYTLTFDTLINGTNSSYQRKFYIKIENDLITDYKGIDADIPLTDPLNGTNKTFTGIAESENERINYLSSIGEIYTNAIMVINTLNYYRIYDLEFEHKNLDLTVNYDELNQVIEFMPNDPNLLIENELIVLKYKVLLSDNQKYDRKLYIEIQNFKIVDYHGILTERDIIDPITNENVHIDGIQRSEPSLLENSFKVELIDDKTFRVLSNKDYLEIEYITIKYNTSICDDALHTITTENNNIKEYNLKSDDKIKSGVISLLLYNSKLSPKTSAYLRRFVIYLSSYQVAFCKGVQSLIEEETFDPFTEKAILLGPVPKQRNFNFDDLNESDYDIVFANITKTLSNNVLTIKIIRYHPILNLTVDDPTLTPSSTSQANATDLDYTDNTLKFTATSNIVNKDFTFSYSIRVYGINLNRQFHVKIENSIITEFKGIQDYTLSEQDRLNYLSDVSIDNNIIKMKFKNYTLLEPSCFDIEYLNIRNEKYYKGNELAIQSNIDNNIKEINNKIERIDNKVDVQDLWRNDKIDCINEIIQNEYEVELYSNAVIENGLLEFTITTNDDDGNEVKYKLYVQVINSVITCEGVQDNQVSILDPISSNMINIDPLDNSSDFRDNYIENISINQNRLIFRVIHYKIKDISHGYNSLNINSKKIKNVQYIAFHAEDTLDLGLISFVMSIAIGTGEKKIKFLIKRDETNTTLKTIKSNEIVQDPKTNEVHTIKGIKVNIPLGYEFKIKSSTETDITIETINFDTITGIVIELNTFHRHMEYGIRDFAYMSDIKALEDKINSLAINSHKNDAIALASIENIEDNIIIANETDIPINEDRQTVPTLSDNTNIKKNGFTLIGITSTTETPINEHFDFDSEDETSIKFKDENDNEIAYNKSTSQLIYKNDETVIIESLTTEDSSLMKFS